MSMLYEFETTRMAGSGIVIKGVAGENVGDRKLVYLGAAGMWRLADADQAATMPVFGLTMMAANTGQIIQILIKGFIGLSTWTWTTGGEIYASVVSGELTQTPPVAPDIVQIVGIASEPDIIYFNSDLGSGGTTGACALLEGHTAYVGFDTCKDPFTNYFLCDGTADDVQIAAALVYVNGLGGGSVFLEEGDYDITAGLNIPADMMLIGAGWNTVLLYNATGDCITITGNNVKIRDLKVEIVAGAGGVGTRPNCILANTRMNLEITKVWLVGDETVADDGSTVRQCGIVFGTVTFSRISLCRSEDHKKHGISLNTNSNYNTIVGNTCNDNTENGIRLISSLDNTVTGNTCQGNTQNGIRFDTNADDNTVTGNTCQGNTQNGMRVDSSDDNGVTGNHCGVNTLDGIRLTSTENNTVTGNTCQGNTQNGIRLNSTSINNTVTGNTCQGNTQNGIQVDDSSNNTIVGNTCNDNDSGNTGSFDGIYITNVSLDNLVEDNICNNNDRYGINIDDVLALRNWIKDNKLRGNTTGAFNDGGTDTATAEFFMKVSGPDGTIGTHPCVILTDGITVTVYDQIPVPMEYQELVSAQAIIVAGGTGNMRRSVSTNWAKMCSTEDYDAQTDTIAAGVVAVLINDLTCFDISAALTAITAGDLVGVQFVRVGGDGTDTVNADCYYLGIRLRYV